jgi:excisionase family DNA binding protein
MVEPVLLTPEEAARALAISRTVVFALLANGELRSIKIGRTRRVPVEALGEFVRGRQITELTRTA